jgi:hypothetical protein
VAPRSFYGFLRASIGVPLFANYVTWPKPQNDISKHLNRNANENKMYSANVPFIGWGMASYYWLRQCNAIHRAPLCMTRLLLACKAPNCLKEKNILRTNAAMILYKRFFSSTVQSHQPVDGQELAPLCDDKLALELIANKRSVV